MHTDRSTSHAALAFTPVELLQAYVSERLDRLVDHMISRGQRRLAVLGSREHVTWLTREIHGFRYLPITAFIERPDRAGDFAGLDATVCSIEDNPVPAHADTVLIADDRCERALHELAVAKLPLGTTVYRIYHRFPIGLEQLGGQAKSAGIVEAKPTTAGALAV